MNLQQSKAIVTTALVVMIADQLTKFGAEAMRSAAIVPVRNPDYTLGLVSASLPVLILGSVGTLVGFGVFTAQRVRRGALPPWACGLLVGGACANLLDRLLLGAVRDFLATPWVVFNLADVAVVVGVLTYLGSLLASRPSGSRAIPFRPYS